MNDRGVPDEIARFFDDFVEAFSSFSGPRIATRYLVPGVALRGDGSIQCLQSRAEIEHLFQAAVDSYHGDGCRGIRFKDLHVVPMGGRSCGSWTSTSRRIRSRTVSRSAPCASESRLTAPGNAKPLFKFGSAMGTPWRGIGVSV